MKFKNDIEALAKINIGTYSGGGFGELNLRDDNTASTVNKSIYVSAQNSGRASIFLDTTAQAGVSQIGFGPTLYAAQNTSGSIEYTNSSSTLVIKTNYQPAITIDSDRNVGIGTTSPDAKLDVNGGIISTKSNIITLTNLNDLRGVGSYAGYDLTNSPNGTGWIMVDVVSNGSDILSQSAYDVYASQKTYTRYSSNAGTTWSSWVKLIDSNDITVLNSNIGIGTTNPQAQLNVVAGSTVRTWTPTSGTSAIFESSNSSRAFVSIVGVNQSELLFGDAGSQFSGRVRYNHSDNKLSLWANGNQHVTVDNIGNVGINESNPSAKLEVDGTINFNSSGDHGFLLNSGAGTFSLGDKDEVGYGNFIESLNGNIDIYNNAALTLRVDLNNRVGIGTGASSISEKLEVNGNVKATKYINQRVAWNAGYAHTSNNTSSWYYIPVGYIAETPSNTYYNNWAAQYDGRVKKVVTTNIPVSTAPTATTIAYKVTVNGTTVFTSGYVSITGTGYNQKSSYTFSDTDATFSAGDRVQVSYNTNGNLGYAATGISIEYTE